MLTWTSTQKMYWDGETILEGVFILSVFLDLIVHVCRKDFPTDKQVSFRPNLHWSCNQKLLGWQKPFAAIYNSSKTPICGGCSSDQHIHNWRNLKNICDHKSKMGMKRDWGFLVLPNPHFGKSWDSSDVGRVALQSQPTPAVALRADLQTWWHWTVKSDVTYCIWICSLINGFDWTAIPGVVPSWRFPVVIHQVRFYSWVYYWHKDGSTKASSVSYCR